METNDWAKLQEELLKAQLAVIRSYLRSVDPAYGEKISTYNKVRSNISIIRELLMAASSPLHISEIIHQASELYGVTLDRESVAPSLSKKVKKGVTFIQTGPNTFGLKGV